MSEIIDLLGKAKSVFDSGYTTRGHKLIDQALTLLKQQPKTLDFAINCGAIGKGDDSCCGCIYWSTDGKLLCNECGTEYFLVEQQPPAGEFTKEIRTALKRYKMGQVDFAEDWIVTKFTEACDRLDRAEATNKELLEACEAMISIKNKLYGFDVGSVIKQVETAIAKAKQ